MTVSIKRILLPIAYFPPVEYFVFLAKAEDVYLEVQETYTKQTYRNRCKIYTANGVLSLSIPVTRIAGHKTKTKDILINYNQQWQQNHWRAIETSYNTSPYFLFFKEELKPFFFKRYNQLQLHNIELLKLLAKFIGLSINFCITNAYHKTVKNTIDLRNHFNPKRENESFIPAKYFQVFSNQHGFIPNLSILDLLFNEGPNTLNLLVKNKILYSG